MGVDRIGSMVDIAVSGLKAQSTRLKLISGNIANSSTTRTATGKPYRRQDVVLQTDHESMNGITKIEIAKDMTDFRRIRMPGHPDADEQGFVEMPNVDLPVEMMNMVVASRAYKANAAVLKRYQDLVESTIELLR